MWAGICNIDLEKAVYVGKVQKSNISSLPSLAESGAFFKILEVRLHESQILHNTFTGIYILKYMKANEKIQALHLM